MTNCNNSQSLRTAGGKGGFEETITRSSQGEKLICTSKEGNTLCSDFNIFSKSTTLINREVLRKSRPVEYPLTGGSVVPVEQGAPCLLSSLSTSDDSG
jgi:hypothetical protein